MWRRGLIVLGVFALLLIVAAGVGLLQLPALNTGPAGALKDLIESRTSGSDRLRLTIESIPRASRTELVFRGVRLVRPDLGRPLLEADSVVFRYDWRTFVRQRRVRAIEIARPRLHADALGGAPRRVAVDGPAEVQEQLEISIPARGLDSLIVRDGSVLGVPGRTIESLEVAGKIDRLADNRLVLSLEAASITVDSLAFALGGTVALANDSLAVSDLAIAAGGSRFRANGALALHGGGLGLSVAVDTLPLADVATLFPQVGLEGGVAGALGVSGTLSDLTFMGRLHGEISSYPLEVPYVMISKRPDGLFVDSLVASSRGARIHGAVRMPSAAPFEDELWLEFEGVNLRALIPKATRLPETDLSGRISWSGSGRTLDALDGDLSLRLDAGVVRDVPFDAVRLDGRVHDRRIDAGRLDIEMLGGELFASGWVGFDGDFDLTADVSFADLEQLSTFIKVPSAGGRLDFQGRISRGSDDVLLFDGSLLGENWTWKGYRLGEVAATGTYTLERGEKTVVAQGSVVGVEGMGKRLGEVRASIRYESGHLFFEEVAGKIADVGFEARGEMIDGDPRDQILITSFAIVRNGVRTEHPDPIELWREQDRIGLLPVHIPFHGGEIVATGEYDARGPKEARVLWTDLDLSDLPVPAPVSPHILDRTSLSLSLTQENGAEPLIRLRASGEADSVVAEGFASVEISADQVGLGNLEVAVRLAGPGERGFVTIEGILTDSLTTRLSRTEGNVRERLPGMLRPDLLVRADSLPIAWIRGLADELDDIGGVLDADWHLYGDPRDVTVEGPFTLHPLRINESDLGDVSGDLGLADSTLHVSLRFDPDWGASSAAVQLPARFDLTGPSLTFNNERPISIVAEVEKGDLAILPLIVTQARRTRGTFTAERLEVSGTLAAPRIDGGFAITGGRTYFRDISESFDEITGHVVLAGDSILLQNIEGKSGEDGIVRVNGMLGLRGFKVTRFDLDLTLDEFYLESIPNTAATIDAAIDVGTAYTSEGKAIPHLTGTIEIIGGVIEQDFTAPGQETAFSQVLNLPSLARQMKAGSGERVIPAIFQPNANPPWTCEIYIRAPGDLWISNKTMDIELAGDATLFRSERGLGLVGSLDALRGEYSLIGSWIPTTLKIEEGEITWSNPDNALDFRIDARATTEVQEEEVEITASGPIEQLSIRATSESEYSEDEILRLLATQTTDTEQGSGLGEAWLESFSQLLSRELLRGVSPFNIGVKYVQGETQVSVGREVVEDVNVTYSELFGSEIVEPGRPRGNLLPDRELRIEYDLSRSFFLEAQTGSMQDGTPFANLDFKTRLGY
jgi:hypothetical protein